MLRTEKLESMRIYVFFFFISFALRIAYGSSSDKYPPYIKKTFGTVQYCFMSDRLRFSKNPEETQEGKSSHNVDHDIPYTSSIPPQASSLKRAQSFKKSATISRHDKKILSKKVERSQELSKIPSWNVQRETPSSITHHSLQESANVLYQNPVQEKSEIALRGMHASDSSSYPTTILRPEKKLELPEIYNKDFSVTEHYPILNDFGFVDQPGYYDFTGTFYPPGHSG